MKSRTNVVLDDELVQAAKEATGLKTKKDVIEEGLRTLIRLRRQVEALRGLQGYADWEGDLREMRKDRELPSW